MSDKTESANLILKLYELRREEVMRKARNWYIGEFHPGSSQDISNAVMGSDTSDYYRMVTSYWDMACSFVTNGAIDEQMFNDANGEHMAVFSKIEPFLAELRQTYNNPTALQHLERVVMNIPDAREKMTRFREMLKQVAAARAQAAQTK
jgi:DNA primase large subunit